MLTARAYDPYGVTRQNDATRQTMYGFTDEQGDPSGMVYLRARYYGPALGRFLTRDTWSGDANQPMSFNRWNYTNGNPVNYVDPTGRCSFSPGDNAAEVESHVHNLSKSYWLDTYTAAGLAVQCWATGWDWRPGNDSWGPAQVSDKQAATPYGGGPGDGLRCYVLRFSGITQCFTPDQIKNCPDINQFFQLEQPLNPLDWDDAATLMQRRIKHAIDTCEGCQDTDNYIIAGMAQNGPGFIGMPDKPAARNKDREIPKWDNNPPNNVVYNWDFFYNNNQPKNTSEQLKRFTEAIAGFASRGWSVPVLLNNDYITHLINFIKQ